MPRRRLACLLLSLTACSGSTEGPEKPDPYPQCDSASTDLRARAATYDKIARDLHIRPEQNLLHAARVKEDLSTFDEVMLSDNSGFWTATYAASQAYRYRVTDDPEALENLRRVLRGMVELHDITGVPGLFARSYVRLGLPGFPTEQELIDSAEDCDLSVEHCKRWNRGSGDFAEYMFKNDVSRDEYAGHLFAAGVAGRLVDDAEVKAAARKIATNTAVHLMDNDLAFIDIDGEPTTFGAMSPTSFGGFPGFLAVQTLAWFKAASLLSDDPRIEGFYRHCMVREDIAQCEDPALATSDSYTVHLRTMGLDLDCKTNWNNHNMAQLAMFDLIQSETDERLKRTYQAVLEEQMWDVDDPRPMKDQRNSLYTFFHEINRNSARVPRDEARVEAAICVMKTFPEVKYRRAVDHSEFTEVCRGRKDWGMTDVLIPIEQRLMDNFTWTRNPYRLREPIAEDRQHIESPEDFLLAYWLGRFHGLIDEDT